MSGLLAIHRGNAPLVIGLPHTGTALPNRADGFRSPFLARHDTDWWIDELYGFARNRGATTVRTLVSRSVIDCNRDPSGASLYPGQATTGLCPTETFDGEALYDGAEPDAATVAHRLATYFDPYHAALRTELDRLRALHGRVVLYDAHSIRSRIPRLFAGELPVFNIGTDNGRTCDGALTRAVAAACAASKLGHVVDGRFRGGWTTRHYGAPAAGIHAIQMELAMRGYMDEPADPDARNWPTPMNPHPIVAPVLREVIDASLRFARNAS